MSTSATVESGIKAYKTVDYVLRAGKGQHMNASVATKHGATYLNILAPGQDTVGMFNGSVSGDPFERILPAIGDHKIRVYRPSKVAFKPVFSLAAN